LPAAPPGSNTSQARHNAFSHPFPQPRKLSRFKRYVKIKTASRENERRTSRRERPETPGRPVYFAIANLVGIGMFGIGGAVALPILQAMKEVNLHVGLLALGQFHCFYALCSILLVPAILGAVFFAGRSER